VRAESTFRTPDGVRCPAFPFPVFPRRSSRFYIRTEPLLKVGGAESCQVARGLLTKDIAIQRSVLIYDTKTFISNVAADHLSKMPANRRNTAHEIFLQFHRHTAKSMKALAIEEESDEDDEEHHEPKVEAEPNAPFEMFHHVMKTGVIYASSRAAKYGFNMLSEDWANMGQGAPEVSISTTQLLDSVGKSTVI